MNIPKDTVLSCVCDFVLFFCLFVDTITLERLNQFEPNFHTFDWNSLARFENRHRRSHATPHPHTENSNTSDFDEI